MKPSTSTPCKQVLQTHPPNGNRDPRLAELDSDAALLSQSWYPLKPDCGRTVFPGNLLRMVLANASGRKGNLRAEGKCRKWGIFREAAP
uniref:Uncharacterized protein n=1 Tax=Saimiri boliviensis boliviensis TaxID=39432 RepID=A0A2K6SG58_SAIBB